MFLVFVNNLLCEIEKHSELGVTFPKNELFRILLANNPVGLAETGSTLQILINIVHNYSKRR